MTFHDYYDPKDSDDVVGVFEGECTKCGTGQSVPATEAMVEYLRGRNEVLHQICQTSGCHKAVRYSVCRLFPVKAKDEPDPVELAAQDLLAVLTERKDG